MDKARLEAFSDGVFAIVMTLLVLDIKLPDGTNAHNLDQHLVQVLPALGTYALSYLIIGMYWVAHHLVSRMFQTVDARILWLNIVHLLFVGLIPFTTSLISEYTHDSWAVAIYGVNILCVNIAGWFVVHYLYRHQHLAIHKLSPKSFTAQKIQYLRVGLLYIIAIILSFIYPIISVYLYAIITLFLILGTAFSSMSWRRGSKDLAI